MKKPNWHVYTSLQEVFDKMVGHLRKQNAKSEDEEGGACLYRGPNGLKCAVGCLIPDELYHYGLEGCSVNEGRVNATLSKVLDIKDFENYSKVFNLLQNVQHIHDEYSIQEWEREFKKAAKGFGLKYKRPENA